MLLQVSVNHYSSSSGGILLFTGAAGVLAFRQNCLELGEILRHEDCLEQVLLLELFHILFLDEFLRVL